MNLTSESHQAMDDRRRRILKGRERLEADDLNYWADRFVRLEVRFWTGARFERYLENPAWWEAHAAAAKKHIKRPVISLSMWHRCRTFVCRISFN